MFILVSADNISRKGVQKHCPVNKLRQFLSVSAHTVSLSPDIDVCKGDWHCTV